MSDAKWSEIQRRYHSHQASDQEAQTAEKRYVGLNDLATLSLEVNQYYDDTFRPSVIVSWLHTNGWYVAIHRYHHSVNISGHDDNIKRVVSASGKGFPLSEAIAKCRVRWLENRHSSYVTEFKRMLQRRKDAIG